jgi:hypothetical protein
MSQTFRHWGPRANRRRLVRLFEVTLADPDLEDRWRLRPGGSGSRRREAMTNLADERRNPRRGARWKVRPLVWIAVRNNTPGSVTQITAQGIVRDAGGKIVATGTDQGFHPALLQLGEVALGFIYLGIGTNVPAGSYMTVQASGKPASSSNTYLADLLVTEVNNTGQQVVGTIKNPRAHAVQAPYSVGVYCTDRSGGLREIGGFADVSTDLAPGATSGFTVDLAGTPCPQFIVGASGFDQSAAGT